MDTISYNRLFVLFYDKFLETRGEDYRLSFFLWLEKKINAKPIVSYQFTYETIIGYKFDNEKAALAFALKYGEDLTSPY
jgi:hypothetical protein